MFVSLEQYYMGRDKQFPSELTPELKQNAKRLLETVHNLLADLAWSTPVKVSSGWRPQAVNAKVKGAAKKSLHQMCLAVDLMDDKTQTLGKLILSRPELLEKHGLWLEDLGATKGKFTNWVHLDLGTRTPRKIRVFKP
jgi:hypothetical protein